MRALIVFDSQFGNTQKIAEAIGQGLGGQVKVQRVSDMVPEDLSGIQLLIVGSPTQGGRATKAVQAFIDGIPIDGLQNMRVTTFDTRFNEADHNFGLRLLMRTIQYASEKMARALEAKGGQLAISPEAFFVVDKAGPLADGEIKRAKEWGKRIALQ